MKRGEFLNSTTSEWKTIVSHMLKSKSVIIGLKHRQNPVFEARSFLLGFDYLKIAKRS